MKIFKLTKDFRFETAHRLSKDYLGKCSNIHGHSWNGEIAVTAPKLDVFDMAIDFSDIKEFCKMVESKLDHKLILWVNDPLVPLLQDADTEVFTMQKNPTSEALAEMIYNWAVDYFKDVYEETVEVAYVRIEETCTSSCTYTSDDDYEDED